MDADAGLARDEAEIRNTVARVALLADMGEIEEYVGLFTEDASWEMPGGPRTGRADIRSGAEQRRAEGVTGPGTQTRHVISTLAVEVNGDSASADSYWQFYVHTGSTPTLHSMGHYRDTFRRTPDGWQLARREITVG